MTKEKSKKILITGASSGVGRSLAELLCKNFHVIVAARRIERLEEYYGDRDEFSIYQVDLGDPEDTALFTDRLLSDQGFIPYLINNAGVNNSGEMTKISMDTVKHSAQVNALSPLFLMRKFLPVMKENNFGRIINITSGAPLNCFPGYGAYSASKGYLNALTVTTAREHADYNIKINLMSPGPVRSEMSPNSDLEPEVCHPMTQHLLNLDKDGPTGKFFWLKYNVPLFPDLEGVQWMEGIGNDKLTEVL